MPSAPGLLFIWGFIVILLRYYAGSRRRSKLPPGPRGIPLFGNAFNIPKRFEWLAYAEWSRRYGSDIIYLNVLGTPIVVLHSTRTTNDLLEKRSALYSDRPRSVMVRELIGWDFLMTFLPYGELWRDSRRVFHQHFTANVVPRYHPRIVKGTRRLLLRLLETPDDFMAHIRLMTGEIIMGVTYGIDVTSQDDPYIVMAENAMTSFAVAGNAGASLVDQIPFLKHIPSWVPGAGFKKLAARCRKDVLALVDTPFKAVQGALVRGEASPSIVSRQLAKLDPNHDDVPYMENVCRAAAGSAYAGGADTTMSSIGTLILAMVLHPDVQRKAQAELDSVIGRARLPEYNDSQSLPYLSALVKEVFRWHPVAPLGVPHQLTTDDEYLGYHFPAGTVVVGNVWAMLHDERKYPQPNHFDPERYLNEDGSLNPDAPNPAEAVFGFGRRMCPARHFAQASVWMTVACILTAFEITAPLDDFGSPIEPSGEYTPGILSYPVPFRCVFTPRSEIEKLCLSTDNSAQ